MEVEERAFAVDTPILAPRRNRAEKLGDFDFCYITDRIIAMGFPGSENCDLNVAARTLHAAHTGHFMVWNLSDKAYNFEAFSEQVMQAKCRGHPTPLLKDLFSICTLMECWLAGDPQNIAVVHCNTGIGRTNTLLACLLAWCREQATVLKALHFLSLRRSIEIPNMLLPSQRRMLLYFQKSLDGFEPAPEPLRLRRVVFHTVPIFGTRWVPVHKRTPLAEQSHSRRRRQLLNFYQKHNPEKAVQVDTLLAKYQYGVIAASLQMVYGEVPVGWHHYLHRALVEFYRKHNSAKIPHVPVLLSKYTFEEVVASVHNKYGAVPAGCELQDPTTLHDEVMQGLRHSLGYHVGVDVSLGATSTLSANERAQMRVQLCNFYRKHRPEKEKDVDNILDAYGSHLEDLKVSLTEVYGELPEGWTPLATLREQLTSFYEQHNRDKLGKVTYLLRNFGTQQLAEECYRVYGAAPEGWLGDIVPKKMGSSITRTGGTNPNVSSDTDGGDDSAKVQKEGLIQSVMIGSAAASSESAADEDVEGTDPPLETYRLSRGCEPRLQLVHKGRVIFDSHRKLQSLRQQLIKRRKLRQRRQMRRKAQAEAERQKMKGELGELFGEEDTSKEVIQESDTPDEKNKVMDQDQDGNESEEEEDLEDNENDDQDWANFEDVADELQQEDDVFGFSEGRDAAKDISGCWAREEEGGVTFRVDCVVRGDIILQVHHVGIDPKTGRSTRHTICKAAFHTGFVEPPGRGVSLLHLNRSQLDGVPDDSKVDSGFAVDLIFARSDSAESRQPSVRLSLPVLCVRVQGLSDDVSAFLREVELLKDVLNVCTPESLAFQFSGTMADVIAARRCPIEETQDHPSSRRLCPLSAMSEHERVEKDPAKVVRPLIVHQLQLVPKLETRALKALAVLRPILVAAIEESEVKESQRESQKLQQQWTSLKERLDQAEELIAQGNTEYTKCIKLVPPPLLKRFEQKDVPPLEPAEEAAPADETENTKDFGKRRHQRYEIFAREQAFWQDIARHRRAERNRAECLRKRQELEKRMKPLLEGNHASEASLETDCYEMSKMEKLEKELQVFYRTRNPAKIADAHTLLQQYNMVDIKKSLMQVYGELPQGWPLLPPEHSAENSLTRPIRMPRSIGEKATPGVLQKAQSMSMASTLGVHSPSVGELVTKAKQGVVATAKEFSFESWLFDGDSNPRISSQVLNLDLARTNAVKYEQDDDDDEQWNMGGQSNIPASVLAPLCGVDVSSPLRFRRQGQRLLSSLQQATEEDENMQMNMSMDFDQHFQIDSELEDNWQVSREDDFEGQQHMSDNYSADEVKPQANSDDSGGNSHIHRRMYSEELETEKELRQLAAMEKELGLDPVAQSILIQAPHQEESDVRDAPEAAASAGPAAGGTAAGEVDGSASESDVRDAPEAAASAGPAAGGTAAGEVDGSASESDVRDAPEAAASAGPAAGGTAAGEVDGSASESDVRDAPEAAASAGPAAGGTAAGEVDGSASESDVRDAPEAAASAGPAAGGTAAGEVDGSASESDVRDAPEAAASAGPAAGGTAAGEVDGSASESDVRDAPEAAASAGPAAGEVDGSAFESDVRDAPEAAASAGPAAGGTAAEEVTGYASGPSKLDSTDTSGEDALGDLQNFLSTINAESANSGAAGGQGNNEGSFDSDPTASHVDSDAVLSELDMVVGHTANASQDADADSDNIDDEI